MAFERFSGLLAAAFLLLVLALAILQPGDVASTLWALFGQLLTLAVGGWAWYGVSKQMALTRHQIKQSDEAMRLAIEQANDTRKRQMAADHARLVADVFKLANDIDTLKLARSYILTFAGEFPDAGRLDGWSLRLFQLRAAGDDHISQSAAKAPFGWGDRIVTAMGRIQRMGDRMVTGDAQMRPPGWTLNNFEIRVAQAIAGLRLLADQIANEIEIRQGHLEKLADASDAAEPAK